MPRRPFIASVVMSAPLWLGSVFLVLAVFGAGCQHSSHTSDPQLRPIERMLDQQLPPGTPSAQVAYFLSSRGFSQEPSPSPGTIVALIHLVDTETLQPVTARATFHFDASNRLSSYELDRAQETPPEP